MREAKPWDAFPRGSRRFESVSIATPATRMVIVYAKYHEADRIEVEVIPVLAIQASIVRDLDDPNLDHERNHAKAAGWKEIDCNIEHDFLITHPWTTCDIGSAKEIMGWIGARWTLVACPWASELDDEKLAETKRALREAAVKHGKQAAF